MTDADRPEERAEDAEGADEAEDSSLETEAGAGDESASGESASAPEDETTPDATSAGEDETTPDTTTAAEDAATAADDEPRPEPSEDDQPPPEAVTSDEQPPETEASDDQPPATERPETERRRDRSRDESPAGAEAIPGAHLEPDLVLEEEPDTEEPDYSRYAAIEPEVELEDEAAEAGDVTAEREPTDREAPAPAPRSALDLAADARYYATGKRKTSVARVILKPGSGGYTVNGRPLESFFPRPTLQLAAREPLQSVGYEERMDVVARLHGGGVSSQAGALRHGIARALVEADPALRGELKRRGFLTRDARAKERRKAGLKKARKRPQFSKR